MMIAYSGSGRARTSAAVAQASALRAMASALDPVHKLGIEVILC